MASKGQSTGGVSRRREPPRASRPPRRARLARGPLTIGDPAPAIDPRLAAGDPYRPDSIADGGVAFALTVRAASVRGLYKRYTGGPRQDDLCLRAHEPTRTLIAAVADGVSGAPRSDLAAALAVRHACAAVARQLDRGVDDFDWAEVFGQAAWALVDEHRRSAQEPEAGVDETSASLASTLLVAAIAVPDEDHAARVQVAAVGDSPAFVLRDGGFTQLTSVSAADADLLDGAVAALPRSVREISEDVHELEPGSVLLLCTDGLALPLAGGGGEVGTTLARELTSPPDVIDFARLLDFSRNTYDDDRTLVAVWRSS
jgi:serine/threonine protein phosphatase PrpC